MLGPYIWQVPPIQVPEMAIANIQLWPFISYNWLFLWDKKTFYKWGFVTGYNWYFWP